MQVHYFLVHIKKNVLVMNIDLYKRNTLMHPLFNLSMKDLVQSTDL
jgi:hypothetical protein